MRLSRSEKDKSKGDKRSKKSEKLSLSPFETDVLSIVWQLGECSGQTVHKAVAETRPVSYSTVKTIVDRREKKDALIRTRVEGRTVFFKSKVAPYRVKSRLLRHST